MSNESRQVHARACGKAILFGEHAVVYGEPAVAIPCLGLTTEVAIKKADGPARIETTSLRRLPTDMARRMFDRARELLGVLSESRYDMEIGGTLPVGMGMGSSAALAVCFLRALAALEGRSIEVSELVRLATEIEKLAHRTPSGIDPAVVASGRPIFFRRGDTPVFLDLPSPFPLLAATTGRASNTGEVVASVRALHDSDPVRIGGLFRRIGEISREGVERLAARDLEGIGCLMDENHEILVELTVSSPDVERLVESARASGSLGAKVSGAGRGGIVLALCPPGGTAGVERALRRAGASGVYPLEATS